MSGKFSDVQQSVRRSFTSPSSPLYAYVEMWKRGNQLEAEGGAGGGEDGVVAGIEGNRRGERGFEGGAALAKHGAADVLERAALDVEVEGGKHVPPNEAVGEAVKAGRVLQGEREPVGEAAHAAFFEVVAHGSEE